jgi:dihydroxyacetone kinase
MKKIMNNVDAVENEMVLGMVKAYPQYIKKLDCGNVVVRARKKEGKVALISGGGSGHEPAWWICRRRYAGCCRCRTGLYFSDAGSDL